MSEKFRFNSDIACPTGVSKVNDAKIELQIEFDELFESEGDINQELLVPQNIKALQEDIRGAVSRAFSKMVANIEPAYIDDPGHIKSEIMVMEKNFKVIEQEKFNKRIVSTRSDLTLTINIRSENYFDAAQGIKEVQDQAVEAITNAIVDQIIRHYQSSQPKQAPLPSELDWVSQF